MFICKYIYLQPDILTFRRINLSLTNNKENIGANLTSKNILKQNNLFALVGKGDREERVECGQPAAGLRHHHPSPCPHHLARHHIPGTHCQVK